MPVNVTVSDLSESVVKELAETFTICVDQSDAPILYSLRITDLNLFQLCMLENENEFSVTTVYGDSLKAGLLLVDKELSFKTKSNKGSRIDMK